MTATFKTFGVSVSLSLSLSLNLGLATTALLFSFQSAEAQSREYRCTELTSYDFGQSDGLKGRTQDSADSRAEQCLKYGVTLDKTEYLRGLESGQLELCTAANGKRDLDNNKDPKRACKTFDNPYIWEFRGEPLVSMPAPGQASFDRAAKEIPQDIAFLRDVINRAKSTKTTDHYAEFAYESLADDLEDRIKVLEKAQSGQSLIPTAVNSPGPKHREGLSGEEIVGGLFKASNWTASEAYKPMRIKKKHCKKAEWESYGAQHGGAAANADEQIATATKKCAKYDIVFDTAAYRTGYDRALTDYCGYERGFFDALDNDDAHETCTSGNFPTYMKGYEHGEIRAVFANLESDTKRSKDLYKYVVKGYNGQSTAAHSKISLIDVRATFGRRKTASAFIANETARVNELLLAIESHKAKHPTLYEQQELGVEPRPDRELDYPIPN